MTTGPKVDKLAQLREEADRLRYTLVASPGLKIVGRSDRLDGDGGAEWWRDFIEAHDQGCRVRIVDQHGDGRIV